MDMQVTIPLTERERSFAERNHYLVLNFLVRNELEMDEYYDVLIFRYLRAVKQYLSVQQQMGDFATQVNRALGLALRDCLKKKAQLERFEQPLSFESRVSEHYTLSDVIADRFTALADEVIDTLASERLLSRLTGLHRQVVEMRADGYSNREIAYSAGVSKRRLGDLFAEIRLMLA